MIRKLNRKLFPSIKQEYIKTISESRTQNPLILIESEQHQLLRDPRERIT